jgi:hypothetical protein
MKISQVKTANKVAEATLVNGNPKKKWKLNWENATTKTYLEKEGRVYLIVSDEDIKKIGGSTDAGGIAGTLKWYEDSALTGKPSTRTYGIHILIEEELLKGKKIEFYCILANKIITPIKGLFGEKEMETTADFKTMENSCKNDYISVEESLPDWNFQEGGKKWPIYISEGCDLINRTSTSKRKIKEEKLKEKNENPN